MGEATGRLEELKPVTFQYKDELHGARQYGLIAEEVAKVYPELVVRDADGRILSVRCDELAPMLLNELQKQKRVNSVLARRVNAEAGQMRKLRAEMSALQSLHQSR